MCFICHFSKVSSDIEESSRLQKGAFLANGVGAGGGGGAGVGEEGGRQTFMSIYLH